MVTKDEIIVFEKENIPYSLLGKPNTQAAGKLIGEQLFDT